MELLRKNWRYAILVLLVLGSVTWFSIRESVIKKQSKRIAELEFDNFRLDRERGTLTIELGMLQGQFKEIILFNDLLKKELLRLQTELRSMILKHKAEIAELTNIPPDTVFVRLQALYPNIGNSPLEYPFSAGQIKPIYTTAISFNMVKEEYVLQGESLKTCLNLNSGYEKGIENLNSQIGNLKLDVTKCNLQIGNYKSEVVLLKKQISRKSFWNRTIWVVSGVAVGVAILK